MNAPKPLLRPIFVTRPLIPKMRDLNKYLKVILKSKILTNNGIQLQTLERELTKVLKVKNLSLFNNGTLALMVGLKALDLHGEVITTPFTFPATVNCLLWNNLTPVFCDIDDKSMNIDSDKIERLITPKTSAILAVHVFGSPCDVLKIENIAQKYHLKVIYDGAHAFETELGKRSIGSFGDMTMFSFHPTKLFHTCEGGALVFKDNNLKEKVSMLRNFGIKNEEEVVLPGINGKMNEIQAAIGLIELKDRINERKARKVVGDAYISLLKGIRGILVGGSKVGVTKNSFQYFPIRIVENEYGKSRNWVYNEFKKYNIFTRKYFYPLCTDYNYLSDLKRVNSSYLPVAKQVVSEVLCLPYYGKLKIREIKLIVNLLRYFQTQ